MLLGCRKVSWSWKVLQASPSSDRKEGRGAGQGAAAGTSLTGGVVEHSLVDVVADPLHVLLQPRQVCRAELDGLAPPKQL